MIRSQSGQSLVMTLVSVAIMGILAVIMASMFDYQQRESKALAEKLSSSDLEKTLIAALADGSVCTYLLTPPGSGNQAAFFDPQGATSNKPALVSIPNASQSGPPLYASIIPAAGATPAKPGPIVVKPGQLVSGYSETLFAKTIQFEITSCSAPSAGSITCTGKWQVIYDGTKTVRALAPASISQTIVANQTSPTRATVTSCPSNTGTAASLFPRTFGGSFTNQFPIPTGCAGPTGANILYGNPMTGNNGTCPQGYTPYLAAQSDNLGQNLRACLWICYWP